MVKNPRPMAPKHLYSHIFYINQNRTFGYGFEWDTSSQARKDPNANKVPDKFTPKFKPKTLDDLGTWEGKTVVIVGSGPSLNKNIAQLNEIKDDPNVVILSCDGSIWDLKAEGIKPTYVITTEADGQHNRPGLPTTDILLDGGDLSFYEGVPLICCTWATHPFLEKWPNPIEDNYYFINYDVRPTYKMIHDLHPEIFPIDGPKLTPRASMVGFFAVEVCRHLKADEIVLIGCDMAVYDNKTGHHSKHFNVKWEDSKMDLKQAYGDHWIWFLEWFDGKFEYNVTNCTEGGVMNDKATDARWMTLADKIHELKEKSHGTVKN